MNGDVPLAALLMPVLVKPILEKVRNLVVKLGAAGRAPEPYEKRHWYDGITEVLRRKIFDKEPSSSCSQEVGITLPSRSADQSRFIRFQLERKENAAAQILQTSLSRTEKNSPGFLLDLVSDFDPSR